MSLHNLAQNMAAHGRNGDSMLMHVTPDEVQGLQSLAMANGGSLSINPHTGLPEANIFSQAWKFIKPIAAPLAGAGLMMIPGMQPLAAAALVGGVGALGTGSLQKGLMAGLSAYGGAGLAGGLSTAGSVAASEGAAQAAAKQIATQGLTGEAATQFANTAVPAMTNVGATPTFSSMGQGLGRLVSDPLSTTQLIGSGAQGAGALTGAAKIGSVAVPLAGAIMAPEPYKPPEQSPGMIRPAVLTRTQVPESEQPRNGSAERRHFRDVWSYPEPYTPSGATGGVVAFNQGGLGSLGGYSDGGRLLRGPGDGVSDSIPATIGQRQPARLADGEFVVPARIVSEIGNGSTEAGARKLYAMMDRVQKARKKTVGKDRVAANTKAEKYLPA